MRHRYLLIAKLAALAGTLLLTGCSQAPVKSNPNPIAPLKDAPELPTPAQYKDGVEQEFMLGGLLKTYDDVAWIGTDAILASGYKPDEKWKTTYVVEPTTDDLSGVYQMAFIEDHDGVLNVGAIAQIDHHFPGMGKVIGVKVMDSPVEPSDQDKEMYRAVKAAQSAPGLMFCQAIYNHVVLPYGLGNGRFEYRVYWLMSTRTQGTIPMGGHSLVRVADDAKTVLEMKPLAKSCMTGEHIDDPKVASVGLSDLALDYPSAVQVFLMWRYGKPIYMSSRNGLLWVIDSKGVRLLGEGNKDLDGTRANVPEIPAWLLMTANGGSSKPYQLGCATSGQCDIDPASISKGSQMIIIKRIGTPKADAGADLHARALALSADVPHAGDWHPLAAGMVGAVITPGDLHYIFEGSDASPRLSYLGGGDEKLGKYVAAHWNKDMTNNDIVHMLEQYLSGAGDKP